MYSPSYSLSLTFQSIIIDHDATVKRMKYKTEAYEFVQLEFIWIVIFPYGKTFVATYTFLFVVKRTLIVLMLSYYLLLKSNDVFFVCIFPIPDSRKTVGRVNISREAWIKISTIYRTMTQLLFSTKVRARLVSPIIVKSMFRRFAMKNKNTW